MSWAEVKNALNSTVGTSEFMPLDRMINTIIKTSISASDNVKETYVTAETICKGTKSKVFGSFTPSFSGSIKVCASIKEQGRGTGSGAFVYVTTLYPTATSYNNLRAEGASVLALETTSSTDYTIETGVIDVIAGTTYYFHGVDYYAQYSLYINNLTVDYDIYKSLRLIKSRQTGAATATGTATVTINMVVPGNCMLNVTPTATGGYATLTDSNTITTSGKCQWELVEFY